MQGERLNLRTLWGINIIEKENSNPNIGEDDCKKLVDVSSTKKDFEDVCIANYRYFLNSNKDSISSNKILQAMYNYIKNKLTMEQKELTYVAPEVEVIEVEVEQGFQASDLIPEPGQ
mgnify:CR=1 FL=1